MGNVIVDQDRCFAAQVIKLEACRGAAGRQRGTKKVHDNMGTALDRQLLVCPGQRQNLRLGDRQVGIGSRQVDRAEVKALQPGP